MPFEVSTIETQISSILSGVSKLNLVSNTNIIPTSFPAATFQLRRQSGRRSDTNHNVREYVFVINVIHECQKKGKSQAKRILYSTISAIVDALESSISLNGSVDWCTPIAGAIEEQESSAQGILLVGSIELVCRKLIQIT